MRLVVAGWVQSVLSDQLAIFGKHPQMQIINEHYDTCRFGTSLV
jgi:hypothetical protein